MNTDRCCSTCLYYEEGFCDSRGLYTEEDGNCEDYVSALSDMTETPEVPLAFDSEPHYRCPTCGNAIAVHKNDFVPGRCQWCDQKIDRRNDRTWKKRIRKRGKQ